MADAFCRFLDFRSLPTNCNLLHLVLPSKNTPTPLVPSRKSRIRRITRKPLHLTLLSNPSSPEFDVISTHEHSDGSLLFRFGDPSEVVKTVEIEKTKTVNEEIEKEEDKDEYSVVKVLDGNNERSVVVKTAAGTNSTLEANESSSTVTSGKNISVVEREIESNEQSVEGFTVVESQRHDSSLEEKVSTVAGEGLKEEEEDSCPESVAILDESLKTENNIASLDREPVINVSDDSVPLSSPETEVSEEESEASEHQNMENEIPNEIIEDGVESVVSESPASSLEPAMSLPEADGDEEINKEDILVTSPETEEDTSLSIVSEAETESPGEILKDGSENDKIQLESDPMLDTETGIDDTEESREDEGAESLVMLEDTELDISLSERTEVQNLQQNLIISDGTVNQNEVIEDGGSEADTIPLMPLSPQSEAEVMVDEVTRDASLEESKTDDGAQSTVMLEDAEPDTSLSERTEVQDLQAGMQNSIISEGTENENEVIEDGSSETDGIPLMPLSPQSETELMVDEETGDGSVEESKTDDGPHSTMMVDDVPEDSILEPERIDDENDVQVSDLVEASIPEGTESKSSESAMKSHEIQTTEFILSSGAALLPHPSKVLAGGEDAYFVADGKWLGVADGVGLWSLQGTEPGVYAQELMKNCEELISNGEADSINNPMELLNLSVSETQSPGSSTALIAQFDGQALHVANIGDSGFIVLREGDVYRKSSPMLHLFHFPKQIERGDDPSHLAEFYKIDLEEDDVIITATDGLLDNLYDQEISLMVSKSLAAEKKQEEIAELLATRAQEVGQSGAARTPFADNAQAAGYAGYTGGKLDDVAVIVSVVKRQTDSQT